MSRDFGSQEEYDAAMQEQAAHEAEMEAQQREAEAAAEQARIENEGAMIPDDQNELKLLRETMVRICKLHGIEDPIQLIAAAENNEETYADILVREVEKHHASLTARIQELERERDALRSRLRQYCIGSSGQDVVCLLCGGNWTVDASQATETELHEDGCLASLTQSQETPKP